MHGIALILRNFVSFCEGGHYTMVEVHLVMYLGLLF